MPEASDLASDSAIGFPVYSQLEPGFIEVFLDVRSAGRQILHLHLDGQQTVLEFKAWLEANLSPHTGFVADLGSEMYFIDFAYRATDSMNVILSDWHDMHQLADPRSLVTPPLQLTVEF